MVFKQGVGPNVFPAVGFCEGSYGQPACWGYCYKWKENLLVYPTILAATQQLLLLSPMSAAPKCNSLLFL